MTTAAPELAGLAADPLAPPVDPRMARVATAAPELAAKDPHAPKLAPDDPRLRLRRPTARTLRTGPIVALCVLLLGAIMVAVALAFQAPAATSRTRSEASGVPPAPIVPETIRNASSASPPPPVGSEPGPTRGRGAAARSDVPDERRLRLEQDFKAQSSGILFEGASGPAEGAADPPRSSGSAPPNGQAPSRADTDPNGQERKNAFLEGLGAKGSDSLPTTLVHARSPYELKAGTIIPTVLITAINSDLPGPVIGQVRENVYDTISGNFLLIPQGARLLAHYDSMVAWGQERVLLCWNRLVLPNGDSINLQCMPAADLQGAAGLTDEVDEHWFRILKGAAVASLLAATTQAVAGNTQGFAPTVPQMWAANAAGDINQVGQQVTRRNLTIQPTITVRPGYSVNVIVTRDMVVPPYPDAPAALGVPR